MAIILLHKEHTKELFKVSAPVMISFLSTLGMVFVNRIFLANYSIDALSATVSAGTLAFGITFGIQNLTLIASVFVAQLNGAKKEQELGKPVWQMIWLSFAAYLIVIPLAIIAKYTLFQHSHIAAQQILVFQCVMLISPLFALVGSLQSFYNGQGKTMVVTYISIIANAINIILDPIFIFGIKGIIPSLGIIGAHIANAIGLGITITILFFLFLSPSNRNRFGTNKWQLNAKLLKECIKIGSPEAIAVGIEILCWGLFYNIMASLSKTHIVVTSIAQSITLLFLFFGLGLEQGTSILAGNFIGAQRKEEVHKILYAGWTLVIIVTTILFIIFTNWPELIVNWFFYKQANIENMSVETNQEILKIAMTIIKQCLPLIAIYIGSEAVRWTVNGLLRAAGDTFFLLCAGIINIVVFMIIPTIILLVIYKLPIQLFFFIWIFFAITSSAISYIRFYKGNWKNIVIIE
jgi:MATE family multidrug resistance protein